MSKPYVVIGGGISGILAAQLLQEKGIEFVGLEKEDCLGGRILVGHHRLCDPFSVEFLSRRFPQLHWDSVEEFPQQRKKGGWGPVEAEDGDEEAFYLSSHFYSPKAENAPFLENIPGNVREKFFLNKTILRIESDRKILVCQDGQETPYEKILWCADLELLNKVWRGDKTPLLKLLKHKKDVRGGVNIDFELKQPLFSFRNTVVFPFRFKESRLRALGTAHPLPEGGQRLHWILFLDAEILEDHDEVAKCLRTFRREIEKEFGEFKENLLSEKIVFLPMISGDTPVETKELHILPDVYYLGPQLHETNVDASLRNLDLVARNCAALENELQN